MKTLVARLREALARSAATGKRNGLQPTLTFVANGREYPVTSWNASGGLLTTAPRELRTNEILPGTISVRGAGAPTEFPVTVRIQATGSGRATFVYVDPPAGNSQLQSLVPARPQQTPAPRRAATAHVRRPRAGARPRWRRSPMAAAALVASVLAAAAIIAQSGSLASAFAERDTSAYAAVATPAHKAVSHERGYLDQLSAVPGQSVAAATPFASLRLRAEPDRRVDIASPCTCTILSLSAPVGAELQVGQTIALLAEANAPLFVEALFPTATQVHAGDSVEISVGRGEWHRSTVLRVEREEQDRAMAGLPDELRMDPRFRYALIALPPGATWPLAQAPAVVRVLPSGS
jgi:hypothetical protein